MPQSGTLTQVLRRRPAPTSVKTCVRSRMSFFGDRKPLSVIVRGSQGPPRGGRTVGPRCMFERERSKVGTRYNL